jgi:hypothetical protein
MRVEEISLRDIKRMSLEELVALHVFLTDSSEENWNWFTLERLRSERNRLISKDIPVGKWPSQLQGDDWEINLRKKLGLKPLKEPEGVFDSVKHMPAKVSEKQGPEPISEASGPIEETVRGKSNESSPQREIEKSLRVDNPFQSDSFGTLLGETGDPGWDEIQKMKREKRGN